MINRDGWWSSSISFYTVISVLIYLINNTYVFKYTHALFSTSIIPVRFSTSPKNMRLSCVSQLWNPRIVPPVAFYNWDTQWFQLRPTGFLSCVVGSWVLPRNSTATPIVAILSTCLPGRDSTLISLNEFPTRPGTSECFSWIWKAVFYKWHGSSELNKTKGR